MRSTFMACIACEAQAPALALRSPKGIDRCSGAEKTPREEKPERAQMSHDEPALCRPANKGRSPWPFPEPGAVEAAALAGGKKEWALLLLQLTSQSPL